MNTAVLPSISVVIPNYNGKSLLENNLPSLYKALHKAHLEYEVILADDCSNDDSVNFIKENYPDIILICNPINAGFAKNINKAIKKAQKDLVFALNTDVILAEDYFIPMLKYFSKEGTFGVTGQTIDNESHEIQDAAKYADQFFNGRIIYNKNFHFNESENAWTPTFYLTGSNALYDRKKLQILNGFDELFSPFYVEDVELSIRAWRLGWKCYFEKNAICKHKTSSTIKSAHKRRKIRECVLRNKMFLHAIHLEGHQRTLFHLKLAFDVLTRWMILNFSFYKALSYYFKNQKSIKQSKVNLEQLFQEVQYKESIKSIIHKLKGETTASKIKFL
jgi:GT2 family glycosyltransferase